MIARRFMLALGAMALIQPPVAVEARILTIPACGGQTHRMMLPGDPLDPDQRRDCAKACHAVTDRRVKPAVGKKSCC
ncbi:MAG: hypothetical protein ACREB7_04910 [Sphingopyxis sp.]|uniref:hypothetical protein n=1 Tax=Sphingopyxis sp. TaxID=1908224 RepID=UPI003D6D048A